MTQRKYKSRLGKVFPIDARNGDRHFTVTADEGAVHFRRLWARKGQTVSVPMPDILEFGINRRFFIGEREFTISFDHSGLTFHESGSGQVSKLSFLDLVTVLNGQQLLHGRQ